MPCACAGCRPAATPRSPTAPPTGCKRIILPALTLSLFAAATQTRFIRSGLLDTLHQDYIRTARAKGFAETTVIMGHALRNALIPSVTLLGLQVGVILEGAFIVESVFAWPGIGRLAVQALGARDYPTVQAVVLLAVFIFLIANLLVDIAYAYLDPRISFQPDDRLNVVAAETRTSTLPQAPVAGARNRARLGQILARSRRREPRIAIFGSVIGCHGAGRDLRADHRPVRPVHDGARARRSSNPRGRICWAPTTSGRDQLSRVIWGTRISLVVAVIAVTIAFGGGVTLGLAAGYLGGWIDQVFSRFIDAMLAFPGILLAIAVTSALGPNLRNAMIAVGIIGIPLYFRLTRGQTLQAREQEYVTAATVLGASRAAHPGPTHPAQHRQSDDRGRVDLEPRRRSWRWRR